jgi:hypothetical protein
VDELRTARRTHLLQPNDVPRFIHRHIAVTAMRAQMMIQSVPAYAATDRSSWLQALRKLQ